MVPGPREASAATVYTTERSRECTGSKSTASCTTVTTGLWGRCAAGHVQGPTPHGAAAIRSCVACVYREGSWRHTHPSVPPQVTGPSLDPKGSDTGGISEVAGTEARTSADHTGRHLEVTRQMIPAGLGCWTRNQPVPSGMTKNWKVSLLPWPSTMLRLDGCAVCPYWVTTSRRIKYGL